MSWKTEADAAMVDVSAALTADDRVEALEHLQDAVNNLRTAIEKLEGDD